MLYFEIGDANVPIAMLLLDSGVAITGATVQGAVWNPANNQFLDFNDNTFKASGWTEKFKTLTDLNTVDTDLAGHYAFIWDSSLPVTAQIELRFIFKYNDGSNDLMISEAVYFDELASPANIADAVWNEPRADHEAAGSTGLALKKIRAALINRQELSDASTGNFVTYDDDGSTPLITQDINDKDGNDITLPTTVPARRGVPS